DARSHRQLEEESVTSLVQMGGVESIGMARDKRDSSPILARTEAQGHYLIAIDKKQLIFAVERVNGRNFFLKSFSRPLFLLTRPFLELLSEGGWGNDILFNAFSLSKAGDFSCGNSKDCS
ncbi:MAG: hypothetical protein K2P90_01270, partial [Holosporales bacterium]|nr:hypothetical protein [Holosporales bacterium]